MNNQEKFWKGRFGNKYTSRLSDKKLIKNNYFFFKKIFKKIKNVSSIIELGPNNGFNLIALKKIFLNLKKIYAVEINKKASLSLTKIKNLKVFNESIHTFNTSEKFDLVITKGVLIHLNPKELKKVYKKLKNLSANYVLIAEYFNPYPVSIEYRGNKNKLFKRDFAKEFSDISKNFKLISYGFTYKYDKYPQDNLTWFLFKKTKKNRI
tara:strand:- start:97 stop:720 length:624 start_codon:yes stop_codon:yes gene_type:complete